MCMDDQILSAYLDGELQEPWKSQVMAHIEQCPACRNRFESLQDLDQSVKAADLDPDLIAQSQARVLHKLEAKILKPTKQKFLNRKIKVSLPSFIGIAAAFALVFTGSLILGNSRQARSLVPANPAYNSVDTGNVVLVHNTDNSEFDSYTVEQAIQFLDKNGYSVNVKQ